jgi:hypothetical protein
MRGNLKHQRLGAGEESALKGKRSGVQQRKETETQRSHRRASEASVVSSEDHRLDNPIAHPVDILRAALQLLDDALVIKPASVCGC